MTYTLRQLQYFVAAADHGSVAGAARALNISQPSISTAIAKLEALLGVRLLLRHHAHGVSLTPAGQPLLVEARSLLAHAGELTAHARGLGEAVRGRLDVGCFVTIAPSFFPAIARGFTVAHGEVDIRLHEGHQDALLEGLASGRFTVALLYDYDLAGDLDLQPLADLAPYALLPGDHPLARRAKVALAELAPLPMVLLDMPPQEAAQRGDEQTDYIEREQVAFHERVREGYLALARAEPARWATFDARRPVRTLSDQIWERIAPLL